MRNHSTVGPSPGSPLVIVDGNCQAHHLAAILYGSGIVDAYATGEDLGFLPTFRGVGTRYRTVTEALDLAQAAAATGRPVYQVSQSTQFVSSELHAYTPLAERVVHFPFLQLYALSKTAFIERFKVSLSHQRIYDLDIGTIRVTQEKAASRIDFASFVAERLKTESLFQTAVHLGGTLTSMLTRLVLEQMPALAHLNHDPIYTELAAGEGMNFITDHPVEAQARADLGFDWGPHYPFFADCILWLRAGDWHRVLADRDRLLATFPSNSIVLHALAFSLFHTGQFDAADTLFDMLLRLSPGHPDYWFHWLDLHWARQDMYGIDRVLRRAEESFQGQRIYSRIRAFTELRRNLDIAQVWADDYYARTPDRADGLIPKTKVMIARGHAAEAIEFISSQFKNKTPAEQAELRMNLIHVPEIEAHFTQPA